MRREARDWKRIVAGPWKWRNSYIELVGMCGLQEMALRVMVWEMRRRSGRRTLSPQIVRLDHVRSVNRDFVSVRHVVDSRMTRKNLVSGTRLLRLMLGIWRWRVEDFSR